MPTLKHFGQHFGKLHVHSAMKGMEEHPEVRLLHADANSKHVAGEEWHTDLSCDPIPPMGSILHIHTLPPIGGDTCFASMYAAYDALSPRMKAYLEGLTATHDGGLVFRRFNPDGKYNVSIHPVIVAPPRDRAEGDLRQPRLHLAHQRAAARGEQGGARLPLQSLREPAVAGAVPWRQHSIAFWDNRCTQHYAVWDYFPQTRTGDRVQIEGANPPFG